MSNIFNKKDALIDAINVIRESASKEYADEHKAKAVAARNAGKMSDYHKHMATHHDHLATHFTDKGDSRAADLHMNKATEHEAKAKEVSEAKLDAVKPHELKKDFKDRQDKDIDNDGKVDSSDEYLHKRRQAISQKMKSEGFTDKEIDALLEYEISRRADGKYVDDEGNVMSRPPSRWAAKKITSNSYNPSYRSKYRPFYGKPKNEEVEIEEAEQFAGWIAHHNGKKLEIRKHEAKDLYDAKQKAIAHFKPKKSQKHMVSVHPAYEEYDQEGQQIDELTASEKKLVNSMYDKKGNLTDSGKKVRAHSQNKFPHNVSASQGERMSGKSTMYGEELDYDIQEQSEREEKHEMAQTQAHFIKYAAEEILEYIDMGGEIEEWYQNKLAKVHSDMESLHSYMEGEKRRTGMAEEAKLEESSEISPKQNMLLRAMAADPKDINKMRRAIKLGDKALMNPVMRQEILKMLDQMMDVSLSDPTIFSKTRQIFKKRKATDTTNTE